MKSTTLLSLTLEIRESRELIEKNLYYAFFCVLFRAEIRFSGF